MGEREVATGREVLRLAALAQDGHPWQDGQFEGWEVEEAERAFVSPLGCDGECPEVNEGIAVVPRASG